MTAASMAGGRDGAWHAQAMARILMGPWQQRWNRDERWIAWLLLPLLLLLPAGLAFVEPGLGVLFALLVLMSIAMVAWVLTAANVLEQNQPAAARLVPGHVGRLRQAMGSAAAATIAVSTLLACLGYLALDDAPASRLHALTAWKVAGFAATGSALAVLFVGLMVRWNALAWSVFVFPAAAAWRQGLAVDVAGRWFANAWSAAPVAATVGLVVLATATAIALPQSGGPMHERAYQRRQRARERFRRRALGLELDSATPQGRLDLGGRASRGAWHRWFERTLSRRASPTSRLVLGLGPSGHWTTLVGKTTMSFSIASVVVSVLAVLGPPGMVGAIMNGMTFGLVFLAATPVMQMRARYGQSRAEQALLVLLPGTPRGPALARTLAMRTTVEFVVGWIVVFAATRALQAAAAATGQPVTLPEATSTIVAIAMLPMVAFAWRRLDRLPAPTQAGIFGDLLAMGSLTGLVALAWKAGVPLAVIGVVLALATAAWCAWRWRRMAGEPSPLPSGRHRG